MAWCCIHAWSAHHQFHPALWPRLVVLVLYRLVMWRHSWLLVWLHSWLGWYIIFPLAKAKYDFIYQMILHF